MYEMRWSRLVFSVYGAVMVPLPVPETVGTHQKLLLVVVQLVLLVTV